MQQYLDEITELPVVEDLVQNSADIILSMIENIEGVDLEGMQYLDEIAKEVHRIRRNINDHTTLVQREHRNNYVYVRRFNQINLRNIKHYITGVIFI